jgi:hypothetical protein
MNERELFNVIWRGYDCPPVASDSGHDGVEVRLRTKEAPSAQVYVQSQSDGHGSDIGV